jgi:hypothetical protein
MGTEKHLLTAAVAAACLTISGVALAAQPTNIEQIRCSNNGKGNGGEGITTVFTGGTVTSCDKFELDNPEDLVGPGTDPLDPNPK